MTIFLLFPTHARLVRHPLFHGRHDIIGSSSSPPLRPITRRMLQPVPPPSLRFGSGRVPIGNSKSCHQRREGSPTLCCCFGVVRSPACDGCSRTQSQRSKVCGADGDPRVVVHSSGPVWILVEFDRPQQVIFYSVTNKSHSIHNILDTCIRN